MLKELSGLDSDASPQKGHDVDQWIQVGEQLEKGHFGEWHISHCAFLLSTEGIGQHPTSD